MRKNQVRKIWPGQGKLWLRQCTRGRCAIRLHNLLVLALVLVLVLARRVLLLVVLVLLVDRLLVLVLVLDRLQDRLQNLLLVLDNLCQPLLVLLLVLLLFSGQASLLFSGQASFQSIGKLVGVLHGLLLEFQMQNQSKISKIKTKNSFSGILNFQLLFTAERCPPDPHFFFLETSE